MADEPSPESLAQFRDWIVDALRDHDLGGAPGKAPTLAEQQQMRVMIEDVVDRKLHDFEKRVEGIVAKVMIDTLRRAGLRVDDEKIDETRDTIGTVFRQSKTLQRIQGAAGVSIALGVIYGILKMLGLHIDFPGGGGG